MSLPSKSLRTNIIEVFKGIAPVLVTNAATDIKALRKVICNCLRIKMLKAKRVTYSEIEFKMFLQV
jgi:hypothetical protein